MIHHHLKSLLKPILAVAHTEHVFSLIIEVAVKCLISADILVGILSGSTIALYVVRCLTGREKYVYILYLSVKSNL